MRFFTFSSHVVLEFMCYAEDNLTPTELHRWARPLIVAGLQQQGIEPAPAIVLGEHGVGWLETRYGTAWKGAGVNSRNWGAIQSGRPPCPPDKSFEYTDTSPNPDGTSTPYKWCFRKYASDELGAADLARVMYTRRPSVLAAAQNSDYYGVSAALHATRYYEGFGKTVAERIANHYKILSASVRAAAAACGDPEPALPTPPLPEPWQDDFLPDNPLILRGSYGPYVGVWQRIANEWLEQKSLPVLAVDQAFGKLTTAATQRWQRAHGLIADGKVGPKTWTRAAELQTT